MSSSEQEEHASAIVEWAKRSYEPISSDDSEMADMKRQGLLEGVRVDLISIEPEHDMWKARLAIAGGRFDVIVVFWLDDYHKLEENRIHIEDTRHEEPGTDVPPLP